MSENLDLVRSIYADWEKGDFSSAEWAAPDIEFAALDGPEPGRWTGRARLAEAFRGRVSVWEEFRIEAEEYRDLDAECGVVFDRRSGRGRASGLEQRAQAAHVFCLRDGKVIGFVNYWDRDRALADLGLEE